MFFYCSSTVASISPYHTPCPTHPHLLLSNLPFVLSMCPLYRFLDGLSLIFPQYPSPPPLWSLSVRPLFQCLCLYKQASNIFFLKKKHSFPFLNFVGYYALLDFFVFIWFIVIILLLAQILQNLAGCPFPWDLRTMMYIGVLDRFLSLLSRLTTCVWSHFCSTSDREPTVSY